MWQEIKKFGPKYSDLPTMIYNVNMLLTLNVDRRIKRPISLVFYLLTASCTVCHYYANLFSMIWFVFQRSQETGDLTAAMVAASLGVTSHIATIKLFYMIIHASRVRRLVDMCLELDSLSEFDTRFSRNMGGILEKVKIRVLFLSTCVIIMAVWYNVVPLFMSGRHLPEDLLVYYGLEPVYETPNYQISYFITLNWVIFISYICISISAFTIVILGFIEAQILCLGEEIVCIWEDSIQDTKGDECICSLLEYDANSITKINKGIRKRLVTILKYNSHNMKLLKNIDNFFNVPNAIAFVCLGISLIAALLGGLENTYLQIPFTFMQVAMDCFTGQRIVDASLAFERAVYSCKWENFNKDNMRFVLLILVNSQRKLTVTAGKMADLNFRLLMSIVQSIYSAYTTLTTMI